jgi:hypothetical protein
VTDYADWGVPQANANMIAATGVPLLGNPNVLLNAAPVIAPGATYLSPNLPVSQLGYEIAIQPFASGSGSAGPLEIEVNWQDATATYTIELENWLIWPGAAAGGHLIYGKGPTKGGIVQISIINGSSAMAYTAPIQVWQRSHPYTRDDWRSRFYVNSASGNAIATTDLTTSLIGYRNVSVAAAGLDASELPLYSGPCTLWFQTASGTTDMVLTIQSSAGANQPSLGTKIFQMPSPAGGAFSAQIVLPRYQCRVQMQNKNAAAQACAYGLFTVEQSA